MPPVLTYPLRTFSRSLISLYLNCKQWYQKSKSGFVDFLALWNKALCIWETHLEDFNCWAFDSWWCLMLLFLLCLIKSNIWVVKCCTGYQISIWPLCDDPNVSVCHLRFFFQVVKFFNEQLAMPLQKKICHTAHTHIYRSSVYLRH